MWNIYLARFLHGARFMPKPFIGYFIPFIGSFTVYRLFTTVYRQAVYIKRLYVIVHSSDKD